MFALALAAAVIADSSVVRSGLASILGESGALEVVTSLTPSETPELESVPLDVVVRDVPRTTSTGEALVALPRELPVLAIVDTPEQARELVRAGARGVVQRGASAAELQAASIAVANGLYVFDERSLEHAFARVATETDSALLTQRERQVLDLVAAGLSNKLIADELGITEHTAKFHLRSIMDKLGADTRTDAVARAARRGMLVL